jgi:hypothetical protein
MQSPLKEVCRMDYLVIVLVVAALWVAGYGLRKATKESFDPDLFHENGKRKG